MTFDGFDVGRADVAVTEDATQAQAVNVMGNGTVRARNIDVPFVDYTYTLLRMSNSKKNIFKNLLNSVWKWAATGVPVIDDDGAAFTGYFVSGRQQFRRRAGPFWSATVTVRRYL
jgi:hypothetical protein